MPSYTEAFCVVIVLRDVFMLLFIDSKIEDRSIRTIARRCLSCQTLLPVVVCPAPHVVVPSCAERAQNAHGASVSPSKFTFETLRRFRGRIILFFNCIFYCMYYSLCALQQTARTLNKSHIVLHVPKLIRAFETYTGAVKPQTRNRNRGC